MSDKVSGYWEVGANEVGEVVVNIPHCEDCPQVCNPSGHHFAFSPDQARGLAKTLTRHADAVDAKRGRSVN